MQPLAEQSESCPAVPRRDRGAAQPRDFTLLGAFTLLELVLVLALLALIMALAAPSLRGWARGTRFKNAADGIASTARWARSQAIVDGVVYRLEVDSTAGKYSVSKQSGQSYELVTPPGGQSREMGDDVKIELLSPDGSRYQTSYVQPSTDGTTLADTADVQAVYFLPTGRTDPAMIRLQDNDGKSIVIVCSTAADNFQVFTGVEGQQ